MSAGLPQFLTAPDPEVYLSDNYVVFDFETSNLDKGSALNPHNRVVGVAWLHGPGHPDYQADAGLTYKRGTEYELGALVEAIERADFCVAHNSKFDLQWAERCGLDLTNVLVYDTMTAEYVIGGNRWVWHALALDKVAERRGMGGKMNAVTMMIKAQVPVEDIPEHWLRYYCKQDVRITQSIFLEQRQELASLNLLPVLYSRCLLTPVLADIEKNGVQLDGDLVRTRAEEIEIEYAEVIRVLDGITGGININSRPQLVEYLYTTLGFQQRRVRKYGKWVEDCTPTGAPKTDAETIGSLKPKTEQQREFLRVYKRSKELYNELTKYLRKFDECCRNDGGLLLAGFNQTSTRTHRLSSTGLKYSTQLHNIPRAYKPLFKARRPGWLVGEADGAQLEFRVAVHLGRDAVGLDDIVAGTDIHSVTASVIGCSRQAAKPHTFKPLYGGRSGTEDERRYYQFFRDKYTGVAATQQRWIDYVLNNKYLTTEWGLRYYWPNTTMDRNGYVTNTTSICNYPVQAFATAEIIPLALVFFWHRLKRSGLELFIVNTVHDSIICEMPPEEVEAFHDLSKQALIDDVYSTLRLLYGIQFTVPLGAGVKIGEHWNGKTCGTYVTPEVEALGGDVERDDDGNPKGEVVYTAPDNLWQV